MKNLRYKIVPRYPLEKTEVVKLNFVDCIRYNMMLKFLEKPIKLLLVHNNIINYFKMLCITGNAPFIFQILCRIYLFLFMLVLNTINSPDLLISLLDSFIHDYLHNMVIPSYVNGNLYSGSYIYINFNKQNLLNNFLDSYYCTMGTSSEGISSLFLEGFTNINIHDLLNSSNVEPLRGGPTNGGGIPPGNNNNNIIVWSGDKTSRDDDEYQPSSIVVDIEEYNEKTKIQSNEMRKCKKPLRLMGIEFKYKFTYNGITRIVYPEAYHLSDRLVQSTGWSRFYKENSYIYVYYVQNNVVRCHITDGYGITLDTDNGNLVYNHLWIHQFVMRLNTNHSMMLQNNEIFKSWLKHLTTIPRSNNDDIFNSWKQYVKSYVEERNTNRNGYLRINVSK
jgi:hypothetical protein